ncbi:MAG: hypothetical protein QRY74_02520 [Chlamydia sp.]
MDEADGTNKPEQRSSHRIQEKKEQWTRIQKRIPRISSFPIFPDIESAESENRFHWKNFFISFMLLILFLFAWSSTSDLFKIPPDISRIYRHYKEAKQRYFQNSSYWDSKREQFEELLRENLKSIESQHAELLLETLTPEILISYLVSNLKFTAERLDQVCIQPKESEPALTIVISKPEYAVWPLKIIVSLEIEVKIGEKGVSFLFTRLRRGSEEMPTGLAWAYFGADLETLRALPITSMRSNQTEKKPPRIAF